MNIYIVKMVKKFSYKSKKNSPKLQANILFILKEILISVEQYFLLGII